MGKYNDKGFSEERCVRCGWRMGLSPLNCNNDNTPHIFPSQLDPVVADVVADLQTYRERVLDYTDSRWSHAPNADLEADMSDIPMTDLEDLLGAVARGWCHPDNIEKTMDVDLAKAIVDEVLPLLIKACLTEKVEEE